MEVSAKRGTTEKMSRLRKVIAQRMKDSLQNSAQLTTVIEVDVTRVARLRARAKDNFAATEGAKLTFLPFFVKAAVEGLKQHPSLNASIDGENIVYHGTENVSMAVDTPKGLITPVIKDAGDLNLGGLPLQSRLTRLSAIETAQMELVVEGILAIQAGSNPRSVAKKLESLLPPGTAVPDKKAA